jgi:LacI family transcriptional regulator
MGGSPELTAAIRRIAKQAGYQPNYHAQVLNRGRSQTLGLLFGAPNRTGYYTGFWGQVMEGVDGAASDRGYDILVIGDRCGETALSRGLRFLEQNRIDALVALSGLPGADPGPAEAGETGRVVVALPSGPMALPCVRMDPVPGIREAVRHLADLGHERILWAGMAGAAGHWPGERRNAFLAAARDLDVTSDEMRLSDYDSAGLTSCEGYEAAFRGYLAKHDPPTAIMAMNDFSAVGIIAALHSTGRRVPRDVSVVGFDNVFFHLALPPLTTVGYNLRGVGEAAARLALDIASGKVADTRRTVSSQFVIRKSTAAPQGRPRNGVSDSHG